MKLTIVVLFGLVCLVVLSSGRPAEEDYAEYEDEPAPPPKKTPARSSLIGRRNPLTSRNGKSTTTTAPPSPAEEDEEEVDEEAVEEQPEQTSSTTEAPKKFLKGGIVRPFRSNDDLLAALKRRREQALINKHSKVNNHATETEDSAPASVQSEPTAKPSRTAPRRRFNVSKSSEAVAEEQSTPAPARTGRRFSSRS